MRQRPGVLHHLGQVADVDEPTGDLATPQGPPVLTMADDLLHEDTVRRHPELRCGSRDRGTSVRSLDVPRGLGQDASLVGRARRRRQQGFDIGGQIGPAQHMPKHVGQSATIIRRAGLHEGIELRCDAELVPGEICGDPLADRMHCCGGLDGLRVVGHVGPHYLPQLHLLEASLNPPAGARPFLLGHVRVTVPQALATRDGRSIRLVLGVFDRLCCAGVCGGGLRQCRSRAEGKHQKHADCGQMRRVMLLEVERRHHVSLLHSGTGGSRLWVLSSRRRLTNVCQPMPAH